jgi:hypothetical protein
MTSLRHLSQRNSLLLLVAERGQPVGRLRPFEALRRLEHGGQDGWPDVGKLDLKEREFRTWASS